MVYLDILLGLFWVLFLVCDIIHKENIATIYQDALWTVNFIYLVVIGVVAIPITILCIINIIFAVLWGASYYLQNKYNTTTFRWMSIVMSALFFVSFILRIMVIIGAN